MIRFCNAHTYQSLFFQMHRNTVSVHVCLSLSMNIWNSTFISGLIPISGRCNSDHFVGLQKTRCLRPHQSIISFKGHSMRWPVPGAHRQSHDFKWSPVAGTGRGDGSHHPAWPFLSLFFPVPADNRAEPSGGRSGESLDGSFTVAPRGARRKARRAAGPFRGRLRRTYRNKMMKGEWKRNHETYSHCLLTNQHGTRWEHTGSTSLTWADLRPEMVLRLHFWRASDSLFTGMSPSASSASAKCDSWPPCSSQQPLDGSGETG